MKYYMEKYGSLTIGLLVSFSMIYLTMFIGYCKNIIGDMIILIISFQAFLYCLVNLIKELFND